MGVKCWQSWFRRRWLLLLVIGAAVVLVILRFGEIRALVSTLVQGQWQWVLAAVLAQVMYYSLYAVQYRLGFAAVDVASRATELLPVLFASLFLNAVVPSVGVSGAALFIDDAARRRQSPARAAEGSLLVVVADLATMVPLVLCGLAYLSSQGVLQPYQTIASALFLLLVAVVTGFTLLGRWLPGMLRALLRRVQASVNRLASLIRRPPPLPAGWADRNATEYIGAASHISDHPRELRRTLAVAFIVHLVDVASLFAVSLAYRRPLGPGLLVAMFSLDVVFSVVTFIPYGLGVAESVIVFTLLSVGVARETALAITVAFRGLNVWLPLAIGFLFLRLVRSFGSGQRCQAPTSDGHGCCCR